MHLGSASFKCEWWGGGIAWLRRQLSLLLGAESDTGSAAAAEHEAARLKRRRQRAERAAAEIAAARDTKLTWHQSNAIAPSAFGALASESSEENDAERTAARDDPPRVDAAVAVVEAPSTLRAEHAGGHSQLCEMGFEAEAARAELVRCGGNVGAAIEALTSSGSVAAWNTAEVM